MGDRKPSEFYRSLMLLAGSNFSQDILKKLWLRKLPKNLSVILASSSTNDINELVKLADNIWEVINKTEISAMNSFQNSKSQDTIIENLVKTTNLMCENFQNFPLN